MPRVSVCVAPDSFLGWAPTTESGLVVWLDAADATPGSPYTWPNRGSLGNFTQATAANKPQSPTAWQGHFAVPMQRNQGNGDPQYLDGPNLSALTEGHIFIAMQRDNDPTTNPDGLGGIWTLGTGLSSHVPFSDGTVYEGFGTNTRKTTVNPSPSLSSPRIYEAYSKANDWQNFLDGVSLFSTGTNTVAFPAVARLGAADDANKGSVSMSGKIGAVLLYDHKLGTTARRKALGLLSAQFSIPVTMP